MSALQEYPFLETIAAMARRRGQDVFLVGGFLRDILLERPTRDMDFAVSSGALAFARDFSRKIKGAYVLLDEDHGCARVVKKTGSGEAWTYDFAEFRGETIQQDLLRRDFGLNTLTVYVNGLAGGGGLLPHIQDHRCGRRDIRAERIRMVSPRAFREDPLRLLRAFSLSAMLGFKIETKTRQRIKTDRDLIRETAAERVRDELFKIFSSPRAAQTLRAMHRCGLVERVIPQVRVMFGLKQGGYHHLDVWRHSLESVAQLDCLFKKAEHPDLVRYLRVRIAGNRERAALIKFAALLHDVGKPEVYRKEGARSIFHAHEHAGRRIASIVCRQLKLSEKERRKVCLMVDLHLRPGYLSNFKRPTERAFFRFMRDAGEEAIAVAFLSMADQSATRGPLSPAEAERHHHDICREIIERYLRKQKEEPQLPLLTGRDLIHTLKLKPGPVFSKILERVEEARTTGEIRTRQQALDLARKILRTDKQKGCR
ncbi:MAG: CCA tRNA nucleotidyltransferase [Candidatus Omnitrophota bacterium]